MTARRLLIAALATAALGLAPPTPSLAAASSTTVPFSTFLLNPCVPEVVALSGSNHFVVSVTVDQATGSHTVQVTNQYGYSGVGVSTGLPYRATGTTTDEFQDPSGTQEEYDFRTIEQVVSETSAPDFQVTATFHLTISASGSVLVRGATFDTDCHP